MVVAVHDLLEALSSMGITVEARNGSLRYRPASAMTPNLLAAVTRCESELLELLAEPADVTPTPEAALSPRGPGAGSGAATPIPARTAPVESIAQSTQLGDDPKVDAEFDRF
ncbi:MAG: hypothetical protein IID41_15150, partial [Planctomycetes bacterium]|nr:hypothetical protein [Planctomycetota bacterium]